jgi:hypothetical protein
MRGSNGGSGEAIRVRIGAVEGDVSNINQQIGVIRDAMATKADMAAILARIEVLAAQQAASTTPNWQAIGVGVTVLVALGGLAYLPINSSTARTESALTDLASKVVTVRQYDNDQARLDKTDQTMRADILNLEQTYVQQQRVVRLESDIRALQESTLPKAEFNDQHRDLQTAVVTQHAEDTVRFNALISRINRLEDLAMKK